MSLKNRHTTIALIIAIIVLIIIDAFVVIRFFTYDKLDEVTYSKASLTNSENIISDQIEKFKKPKTFIIEQHSKTDISKDDLESTNELKTNKLNNNSQEVQETSGKSSSRSSTTTRNIIKNSNNKVENTNNYNEPIKTNVESAPVVKTPESPSIHSSIPTGQTSIGTIEIPKTNVNLPILQNVTVSGMEVATCFLYSTGSLNNKGTTIIVGHNYRNGRLFSNNNQLQVGDIIYITTSDGNRHCYTIYDKFITTPDDLNYVNRNTTNQAEIALSCCTNDEQGRIIILAK